VTSPTNSSDIWATVVRLKLYNTDFHSVQKFDGNNRPFTTAASNQDFNSDSLAKFQKSIDILLRFSKEVADSNCSIGLRVEFELEIENEAPTPGIFW